VVGSHIQGVPVSLEIEASEKATQEAQGAEACRERKLINWSRDSEGLSVLRLTPGEKIELSAVAKVSRSSECGVDVAILGAERLWRGVGQWKASHYRNQEREGFDRADYATLPKPGAVATLKGHARDFSGCWPFSRRLY
jgi:hypothetical protein